MGQFACAEVMLNFVQQVAGVRTYPQGSLSTMHILFLSFLVCELKVGPSLKSLKWRRKKISTNGLSACAGWILSFVQEIAGVSTDPQGSWSTMHILSLNFLVCKAKSGPPDPQGSWSTMQILLLSFMVCELKVGPSLKWRRKKKCFHHGTLCLC